MSVLAFTAFAGLLEMILELDGIWTGILAYLVLGALMLLYVLKVDKAPLSSVGLKRICIWDIPRGLLLGCCMFAAQQLPLLALKADYGMYAMPPDIVYIVVMSLYCLICVGLVEELIFRGFILQKTRAVCGSPVLSIGVNILLFYAVHWSSMQFTFGEFYSIAVNVLFLSVYFLKSERKSIVPLIVAHGFYDILTSVILPVFVFLTQ